MASVATCSAVSWPKVTSVQSMSLSMVFGTPTTGTFSSDSQCAAVSVPSPPIGISTSIPLSSSVCLIWSRPASSLSGLTRAVPSMVPPLASSRSLRSSFVSWMRRSSSRPRQPSWKPTTVEPYRTSQVRTTALITAFSPGQSPPPVSTPIRMRPIFPRYSAVGSGPRAAS